MPRCGLRLRVAPGLGAIPAMSCIGLLLSALLVATNLEAHPPCDEIDYSVRLEGPHFILTLVAAHTYRPPGLDRYWYQLKPLPARETLASRRNVTVSSAVPVTYLDRDGDANLSAGDAIQVWDIRNSTWSPEALYLGLFYGARNASYPAHTFELRDGYDKRCRGTAEPPWDAALAGLVVGVVISGMTVAAILRAEEFSRRRRTARK